MEPSYLQSPTHNRIAYFETGGKGPTVLFCGGFKSDMSGTKALHLEQWCRERGQGVVRFDYSGHGQSEGRFEDGTIGSWLADALAVLDEVVKGYCVVVGSSMGGWIALLLALKRPERVKGLVGIASAPDFTEELMWDQFQEAQREALREKGRVELPSAYGEPYVITRELIENGRSLRLLNQATIPLPIPMRLVHGMHDEEVPWSYSARIAEKAESHDVEVHLIKDGDHRLSKPHELDVITASVAEVLAAAGI